MQKYKTIQIAEALHKQLKLYCVQNGYSMIKVLEGAIGNIISARPSTGPQKPPAAPHRTPHQFVGPKESIHFD